MSTYFAVEELPYSLVDEMVLLKCGVAAKHQLVEVAEAVEVAVRKMWRLEEQRFFEPMSTKEWRTKGYFLADVGPVDRDPHDDEFLAAMLVANALQRALT